MTDDDEKADREWMVARGWVWADFLNFEWDLEGGVSIYLELVGGYFQILVAGEEQIGVATDSMMLSCRCNTRGDIRRIERVFNLPAKEVG